jgi:hypothetical protein
MSPSRTAGSIRSSLISPFGLGKSQLMQSTETCGNMRVKYSYSTHQTRRLQWEVERFDAQIGSTSGTKRAFVATPSVIEELFQFSSMARADQSLVTYNNCYK